MFEDHGLLGVLLEYIIVFMIVFIINYLLFIRKKQKFNKKKVPIELNYLISLYQIDVKDINYKKFVWLYNLINAFIIVTIYIIIVYLIDNFILQLVFAVILLLLLTIICYGIVGRYYQKKGEKKCMNIEK